MEIAKERGRNQSSIIKALLGTPSKFDQNNQGKKVVVEYYGGLFKKLRLALIDNPQYQSLQNKLNQLQNEGYSFSHLYQLETPIMKTKASKPILNIVSAPKPATPAKPAQSLPAVNVAKVITPPVSLPAVITPPAKETDLIELARLLVGKTNQLAALQAEIDQIKSNMRELLSKA